MLDWTFVLVGLLLLASLLFSVRRLSRQNMALVLPRAVRIAKCDGWVSPGRLMAQENLSEKEARAALMAACRQGLLVRGEDGRFYPQPLPKGMDASSPKGRQSAE